MTKRPVLLHCSYHKCMTVYTKRVLRALFNRSLFCCCGRYRHFRSNLNLFYANLKRYRVLSLNNCCPDLNKLGDFRMTRFIRDPRDLIMSGYFYHCGCNEKWTVLPDPRDENLREVNGCVPSGLKPGESYRDYLMRVSLEEGLIAEIQFRKHHFGSMMKWQTHDPRIHVLRYEDILGHEKKAFREMFEFYGLSETVIQLGLFFAGRYAVKSGGKNHRHIRNPRAGQWHKYFTDSVSAYLEERHPGLISYLNYE
ncbi:MAG: sulfotransferase domain-containing protein [Acidobacteria bacterium]|nr:sulfotransferase domain-containing protein [Acidobacteriota bacterium]